MALKPLCEQWNMPNPSGERSEHCARVASYLPATTHHHHLDIAGVYRRRHAYESMAGRPVAGRLGDINCLSARRQKVLFAAASWRRRRRLRRSGGALTSRLRPTSERRDHLRRDVLGRAPTFHSAAAPGPPRDALALTGRAALDRLDDSSPQPVMPGSRIPALTALGKTRQLTEADHRVDDRVATPRRVIRATNACADLRSRALRRRFFDMGAAHHQVGGRDAACVSYQVTLST